MITEEEYRKYDREIDEYIDQCIKEDIKQHKNTVYFKTDKWKNDLRIKSLKCNIYIFTKHVRENYYYLTHPDEAVRKKLHIEEAEKSYNETLEKLEELKFCSKIFYSSPHMRKQYIDDDITYEDIQKEIDKAEERLESLEERISAVYDDNKIEKVMEMYERHYINNMQKLSSCQKKLKEIEKN
jgi:hypothetical protein